MVPPGYGELTQKLVRQLDGAEIVRSGAEDGITPEDMICSIVSLTASGFFGESKSGQEPHHLSVWHASVKRECSDLFAALRDTDPSTSRATINDDPQLRQLNAVRKGLRLAMRRSYDSAKNSSKSSSHFPGL